MGLTISVTNMKGGVGKTTLTANIGHCLTFVHNFRVLLVDVDPQFNLTQYCMDENTYEKILSSEDKGTIHNIFLPKAKAVPKVLSGKSTDATQVVYVIKKGLDIIPSSIHLIDFIDQRKSGSERLLNNYLKTIKSNYDFIFIDCPPTSTILSRAAYLASDYYLIPMGMDYFSVMGLPLLQKDINEFKETYGANLQGLGIVKTRYLGWTSVAKKHKKVVDSFAKQLNIVVLDASFRQRQEVQNAIGDRKFIIEHDSDSDSAKDIRKITEELLRLTGKSGDIQ